MLNKKTRSTPATKIILVIVLFIVGVLILATFMLRSISNQTSQRATTANTNSLDSVMLSDTTELTRQTGQQSCTRTAWYQTRVCAAYEVRIYKVSMDNEQFTTNMQQALLIHGWASDIDLSTADSFFLQSQRKGFTNTSTAVSRLAYANNDQKPLQTKTAMTLTNNPSPSLQFNDGSSVHYTDSLKKKINDSLAAGAKILIISSRTNYRSL